ncbi:MAG: lactonase family protein [Mangrovibacterium sp.]
MKTSSLFIALISIFFLACSPSKKEYLLYAGTYSVEGSEGIYGFSYNPETGELTQKFVTPNQENPSYLEINPAGTHLYAVSEVNDFNQLDSGSVTAYKISENGELVKINQEATLGNHPCHVCVSPDGQTVVASNYTSGSLSIYEVDATGGLHAMQQLIQHEGSGPDSTRQLGPHAHSAQFTKDGKLLIAADLGTDKIYFYERGDNDMYQPASQPFVEMPGGFGPRHFDFSPDGQFLYVMNEMGAAITVLQKTANGFEIVETVSSLPAGFEGIKASADIHLSPDARFVYASNRGHNSIAVFSRDAQSGKIELVQSEPVRGDWPRNFVIDPDGKFLLVANQRSNNITAFAIDQENGKLTFTGQSTELPSPVCLKFLVK